MYIPAHVCVMYMCVYVLCIVSMVAVSSRMGVGVYIPHRDGNKSEECK